VVSANLEQCCNSLSKFL